MATAKKLPSGNYRVNAFIGMDENGKRKYKSFTAPTKKEAEYMASVYQLERKEEAGGENITLNEAFDRYITSKSNVLSPSTVRDYRRIQRNEISRYNLSKKRILNIDNEIIQRAVNEYSLEHSPKSTRNFHALISAVLGVYRPNLRLTTTLPQKEKPKLYLPTDDDIKKLLKAAKGTEIEKAIMLAAFGSLRRSEIAALTAEDVKDGKITVSKAMVVNPDNQWTIKQPKSYAGYRTLEMPQFVIERLPTDGPIVNLTPNAITKAFTRALKAAGVTHFRFHDLRHYQASILHAMGVPDKYIIARGGWKTEVTLKNIYQHTMDKKREEVEAQICCRFTQMMQSDGDMQHEMQHDEQKKAL